jgi:hypothetical protein
MRIDVSDLRTVATRLFDHLDSLGERTVDLDQDYYWVIPDSQLYDPTQTPTEFVLGQLTDDWHELSKVLEGKEPISYALVWLGAIMRAIGEEIIR